MELDPVKDSSDLESASDDPHIVRGAEILSEQTGIPYSEALRRVTGSHPIDESPPTQRPRHSPRSVRNTSRRGLSPEGRLSADDTPQTIRAREELEDSVAAARLIPQDPALNSARREVLIMALASEGGLEGYINRASDEERAELQRLNILPDNEQPSA